MVDTPLLQLDGLTKSFGAVRALRGVSFSVHEGEVHALLGENGAGKSTLIKTVTGALAPDSGRISVRGKDVARLNPGLARELGIACIYQQPALFPDLSVAENIALRLETASPWRRVDRPGRRRRAAALLDRLGAAIFPDTEAGQLSMPDQQLVEIASALGAEARVLLMDEPTASLTRNEQDLLFRAVEQLRRDGVGVVYISHRLEEIFALANRVTVLRDGASVGTWRVGEIDEPALIRAMVGRPLANAGSRSGLGAGETVLSTRNLACAAGGVRSVSLDLRAGEIVGLAGLVGSGRTELACTLFGLTPADGGEIRLQGRAVTIDSPRRALRLGIAYVPEDRRRHGAILEMSVAENISLASHPRLFPGGWLRGRAERGLSREFMGRLGVVAAGPNAPVASLSGGNQQKVALARWLATRPRVLLLDEPTQGVDVGAKSEIHRIVRQLAEEGAAVLLISSDLPEILALSHRVGVMRLGSLVAMLPGNSTPAEVMARALGQAEAVP